MSDQTTRTPTLSKQQEREQRILDSAAELILRWGYDKTTVDDISQKAGVAKGTIYLHWKTREDLFEALLWRKSMDLSHDFRRRVAEDPDGATLRGIYRQAALALIKRPLLKAVLLGDRDIIGRLARTEQNQAFYAKRWSGFNIYLEFLRQHNLVRLDMSLQAQVYAVTAIFAGFFMVEPIVPDEMKPSDEEIADLIGKSIHRTLETTRAVPPDEMKSITDAFMAFMDQAIQRADARLQSNQTA